MHPGSFARAACALVLVGCGSPYHAPPTSPVGMTPPSDAELLASRPYFLTSTPIGYTATQTWPLLIVLAGAGGHGFDTAGYLGFTTMQDIFLVAPDPDPNQFRLDWDPNPQHWPFFDVEYVRAIIRDVEAKYSIDRARVFVAGHSLGAHMAHRMACDDADDVVAILSLAGQVSKVPSECAPSRAVSVVQVHGTTDPFIGYYGDVQNDPPDPTVPSAHETVGVWARNDACSGAIVDTGARLDLDVGLPGDETTVEAYGGCPAGIGVELWSIVGGTHRPGLPTTFPGLAWTFLTAHAR